MKILGDEGGSVDSTNGYGSTPLHVSGGFGNLEPTKTLVETESPLYKADKDGYTPLPLAAKERKLKFFPLPDRNRI